MRDQWHDLFLGSPVREIGERIGLEGAPLAVVEATATELPLPGDGLVRGIKHVLQFTGVVVGLATGNPPLANACVKSFAHDVARRAVARSAMESVHAVFTPVREVTRLGDVAERPAAGTADLKANPEKTARLERSRRDGPDPPNSGTRPGPDPPGVRNPPDPGRAGPGNQPGRGRNRPARGGPGFGYLPGRDDPRDHGTRPGRDDEPGTGFGVPGP